MDEDRFLGSLHAPQVLPNDHMLRVHFISLSTNVHPYYGLTWGFTMYPTGLSVSIKSAS